jgi:GH24 family phage-related lysozyme (muramidase)
MTTPTTVLKFGAPLVLASAGLMAFLGDWEPDKSNPGRVYPDTLAGGLPTVCKGITKHVSPYPVVLGDVWSEERCAQVERMVTERSQLKLLDCINVRVSQNTFDALSSHSHNFGVPTTCVSKALGFINAGHLAEGCRSLAYTPNGNPNWSSVKTGRMLPNGQPQYRFVQGLHNRRKAEAKLCAKPDEVQQ